MKEKLELEFLREPSTVGELISLTDRPARRQSQGIARRGSLPTSRSEGTRSRGRQRGSGAKSVSPVVGSPRKQSVSTSRRNSILSSRRESAELSRRSSISNAVPTPDDRESPTKALKSTRRESMLNVLRGNLEKRPCLLAVHKRRQSPEKDLDRDNVFTDTETGTETEGESSIASDRRKLLKGGFKTRRASSVTPVLTDAEIRKLQMIQTLNKMGITPRRPSRRSSVMSDSGEAAVMEATYGAKKRGSIATRVMLVAAKRKSNVSNISSDVADVKHGPLVNKEKRSARETPAGMSDSEEMSDDQKQKTSKLLDLLKKPDKVKLPSIVGKNKSTSEEVAVESMNVFRRKLRRRKMRPKEKFRKLSKFLLLLLRAWRWHSAAINDVLVSNNDSLDMITSATNPADLMFDVTQYKAVKEAKVSQEAIRILKKKPKERTEEEQYYIQIALRNYKSIAEYPVKMQKLIAKRSWFESYDPKRVVVREGHVPMCFYFILSGSAVVSTSSGERQSQKTVMFLNRGDSFGDVAILNGSRRETTVISREKIELLVMGDTDFIDIFMSGGISNPNDPFLKSVNFLDGWPIAKLIENPKKCIFSFFKRGTVLVQDSHTSEWIFIIRSGSASILKKLQTVNARMCVKVQKKLDFRDEVLNMMKNETYLSHEDKLTLLHEEEKRELDDQNLLVRYYALPEINIKTNDGYNELKQMREEYMNQNTLNRALVEVENLAPDKDENRSETGNSDATGITATHSKRRKMSMNSLNLAKMVEKGPYMLKSRGGPRHRGDSASSRGVSLSRRSSIATKESHGDQTAVHDETKQKVDDWQDMSLPTIDEPPMIDLREKLQMSRSVFVEVQNLTKGQTFGLTEMLFEGQPNFSLVSNGAECVMIEKKFFLEHATHKHLVKLREATYPYPSNEALQENLESQMRWDHHKKKTLHKMLRDVRIKKADGHDARALLQIPAALTA